jgi:hypothetical protein
VELIYLLKKSKKLVGDVVIVRKILIQNLIVEFIKKLVERKKRNYFMDVNIVIENLQQNMDVEFMSVHVRKHRSYLLKSQEHVTDVDVRVTIHQIVMPEHI